jgi:TrmH family RNA methyltransferase
MRLRERRHRDRQGRSLVEGRDEVALAIASGAAIETLFIEEGAASSRPNRALLSRLGGTEVIEVTPAVFARLAYRENPDGWLAVIRNPYTALDRLDQETGAEALLLVVDGIEKPGNLGAMLRTADAAGATGVIVSGAGTDPWNPNAIRASKGAVFAVPLAVAPAAEAIAWLRDRDIRIIAADPAAATTFTEAALVGPLAIVVGAEDEGLSPAWRQAADDTVSIPMRGHVNSLNVAASAALLLYEAVRQRRAAARRG